ncbi:MAG: DNA cytosine methyltransferase [Proteobacteria bacterium]|nr:DNA cytosine methyltransferase [Pseudomonadota bacterium]
MPRHAGGPKRAKPRTSAARPVSIRCVDLFAGAGGFSLAAKRVGITVAAAVEHDKHACETYRRNIVKDGEPRLYEADITKLEPSKVIKDCFGNGAACDVVLGGPPCQGFSVHRINDAGKNDPRNALIHRYFEFVSALNPRAFLLENVPGILWPRHAKLLQKFYDEAARAGYRVHPVVVDARDFGLPQGRKRVFILGLRTDVASAAAWVPEATHGSPSDVKRNPRLKPWVACGAIFKRKMRKNDPNNIHMNHSSEMVALFKKTPANGGSRKDSGRVLPCHKDHDGHKDVYGRIDPKKPGPTMTTACINPSKGRFLHPTKHHGITLRHRKAASLSLRRADQRHLPRGHGRADSARTCPQAARRKVHARAIRRRDLLSRDHGRL